MKNKVVALLLCLSMAVCVGGCGSSNGEESVYDKMSKKQLLASCKQLDAELSQAYSDYDALQQSVNNAGIANDNLPNIKDMEDGTGRKTFVSNDDIITFSKDWVYPNSIEAANTSSVSVSKTVSFKPYENWLIMQKGNTTELNHKAGISGKISVGNIEDSSGMYMVTQEEYEQLGWEDAAMTPDVIKERIVNPWINELANVGSVVYSELYLEDTIVGIQAETTTLVDGNEAHLKFGMFNTNRGEACQYIFIYTGSYDSIKEEHMDLLISSIKVQDTPLLVD